MTKQEIKVFLNQLPDDVKSDMYFILSEEQESRKFKAAVNPVMEIVDSNGRKLQ